LVKLLERTRQHANIRDGQVHALRARGRDNMSGVAREKESAELHGLRHNAPHPGDALFEDRSFGRPPAIARRVAGAKFFPDPRVRPLGDVFIRRALQIQPCDLGRAHAEQREPPFVIRVDQLLGRRRRLRQNTEPRERVHAFENRKCAVRDRAARDTVRAIASRQKIASKFPLFAALAKLDRGARCLQPMQADVAHFKMNLPPGIQARLDQILDNFLLRVHCDGSPWSEVFKIDAMPAAAETQFDPVMHQPLLLQARAHPGFDHQIHRALLQHARANPLLHIMASTRFKNYRLDSLQIEQMRKHQPRRPRADYPDLGAHAFSISSFEIWNPVLAAGTPAYMAVWSSSSFRSEGSS